MLGGIASLLALLSILGSVTIQSTICVPPSAPTIDEPVNGSTVTIGSTFAMSGYGEPDSSIILSDNGVDIMTLYADEANQYFGNSAIESIGSHAIGVRAERSCGTTSGDSINVLAIAPPETPYSPTEPNPFIPPSQPAPRPSDAQRPHVDVTSDEQASSKGLSVSISSPQNDTTTAESSVFVSGTTSEPAAVDIEANGRMVGSILTPRTVFGMSVPLDVGENTIVVSAKSADGSASVTLTVVREETDGKTAWYQTAPMMVAAGVVATLAIVGIIKLILLAI